MPRSPHGMPLARPVCGPVSRTRRPAGCGSKLGIAGALSCQLSLVRAGVAVAQWRGMVPGRGLAPRVWTLA
jgi:hypothetical protein